MALNSVGVWIRNANASNTSSVPSSFDLWLYAADINNKPTGSALYTIFNNFGVGAWAAVALLVGTAGFMRWRKRARVS